MFSNIFGSSNFPLKSIKFFPNLSDSFVVFRFLPDPHGFPKFPRILSYSLVFFPDSLGFFQNSLIFFRFLWDSPEFSFSDFFVFLCILSDSSGFSSFLSASFEFPLIFFGFFRILPDSPRFFRILPDSSGFLRILRILSNFIGLARSYPFFFGFYPILLFSFKFC